MSHRLIAIGDIHGCLAALQTVLAAIQPSPRDTIVTLGDYVDRGPDSCGVLETLIALGKQTRLVPLLGNHDEVMLAVCRGHTYLPPYWLFFGGDATLASYDKTGTSLISAQHPPGRSGQTEMSPFYRVPPSHLEFLDRCRLTFETERHFFVHANYDADAPLNKMSQRTLLWESLKDHVPGPHVSGKTAIMGHSAQKSGEVLDLGHLRCIDTWCYGNGWLTAMDVQTGQVWQADKHGTLRK